MLLNCQLPVFEWPLPASDYEANALAFCQAWQSGQAEFVLHTSGSTGTPKPIVLTRTQMAASAQLTGQTFALQPGNHALVCLNIRYIAGVMMLVRGLELGLTLTIVEPSSHPLAQLSADTRFDFAAFVPLQLQTILAEEMDKLPLLQGMKAILIGGVATNAGLEQALQVITAPVWATYGMTETVSHIAIRRLNGAGATPYFTALSGVLLGIDDRSCLHITAPATNNQLVQTNDVVDLLTAVDPNRFSLLGRADRVLNTGGVKVRPEQVEAIIEQAFRQRGHAIPRLFVAGLPDDRLGQRVVVFVEVMNNEEWTIENEWGLIRETIRQEAGPFAVPKELIRVAHFAETESGKIDRNQTSNVYLANQSR